MKKQSQKLIRFSTVFIALAAVGLCIYMLFQFKSVKDAYEQSVDLQSSIAQSQAKAIDDNYAAINDAGKLIYSQNNAIEQMQSQVSSLQSALEEQSDYDDQKICYLTFDDGPSENTPEILAVLKKYNAKATFFVIGQGEKKYMKDIVKAGHTLGLHSYTHNYSHIYSSESNYYDDLKKIHDLVESETGVDSRIIRFPGGSSNTVSADYCRGIMSRLTRGVEAKGYSYFDWNCDSSDASGNNIAVEKLISHTLSDAGSQKHINILMHDTGLAKKTTVEALPKIIEKLRAKGYSFRAITSDTPAIHHNVNN